MLYECAMNNRRQLVSREELLFYHTLVTTKLYFLLYFLHFLLTSGERLQLTHRECVNVWVENMISFLLCLGFTLNPVFREMESSPASGQMFPRDESSGWIVIMVLPAPLCSQPDNSLHSPGQGVTNG